MITGQIERYALLCTISFINNRQHIECLLHIAYILYLCFQNSELLENFSR